MSTMSYISVVERYHEHRATIQEMLASILTGIAEPGLIEDAGARRRALRSIREHYPFVNLLYTLDAEGVQNSDNLGGDGEVAETGARGKDRSQRPYYPLARDAEGVVVTEPYLSSANRNLCLTSAVKVCDGAGTVLGYIVLDCDVSEVVAFLLGDNARRRFQPLFKGIYGVIVGGLFLVMAMLLAAAGSEVAVMFTDNGDGHALHLKPFSAIIFLTLALAIFDLGKTILEEEVLMHKDIFRHSSTRRTITRFIAAILIAVSIEALLMMFKSALGDGEHLFGAVAMMLAGVGLLIGLGIYVFLGARAEAILLDARRR